MTSEQLRKIVIDGCRRVLNMRILVSREEKLAAAAQLSFWGDASQEELDRLLSRVPERLAEPSGDDPDVIHQAAISAARSMRDRASRTALQHSAIPCAWVCNSISIDIDRLPLLEEK